MLDLELSTSLLLCLLSLLFYFFFLFNSKSIFTSFCSSNESAEIPRSYPLIGSFLSIYANRTRLIQWTSDIVTSTSTSTFVLHRPLGCRRVFTANPSNVQHILKTHFHIYQKGEIFREHIFDLLGDGIFSVDGENWKFQRQVASHEFNTKFLRKFVETVVDTELSDRLIPIFSTAAANKTVLDLQDILQRFGFDNICKISFGHDPAYLLPSLPQEKFAVAFETAVRISGKSSRIRQRNSQRKKQELGENSSLESVDLLSRILSSGHSDVNFVTDIVISFILAGRDTTSAALTWFFWLILRHPDVENEILKEINEKSEDASFEEVKDMVYTHASLSESMRLYPPVPIDSKEAIDDDVLPDGTVIKKGTRVAYHPYAMGRSEKLWGRDWAEFRPERWLEKRDEAAGKWSFVARDPYTYPVFQAGPRICLGKEMAFLQMKRVVSGVLRRFRVVPAFEEGEEPILIALPVSKMKGGFPVKIEERVEKDF
ncbi:Cytochrome P450 94A2 [Camellia lanceoleosa]|uniref:Cytochrome P450 94A2 n=1 Tax=Camellia lanceoleosa TaxID=1840588 RepID=A0ACC0FS11_9ERIC|nr:Cytochrome P450 94A2 [Camellia lanceoleosa]